MLSQRATRVSLLILSVATLIVLCTTFMTTAAAAREVPQPHTWQAVVGIQSEDQAIQGMALLPNTLWINVGDTVVWTAKGADIHTVTFLKAGQQRPPFNPNNPLQVLPQGSHIYDGVSYYNSGLMSTMPGLPGGQKYSLTFAVAGDYTYYCLLHASMSAKIHVRPVGTRYPYTQAGYNRQIERETRELLRDGWKLADQAEDESTNLQVTLGIGDSQVNVMRFFPQRVVIHVGQTVRFTSRDSMDPHTVTFGANSPQGSFAPYGNPRAFDGSTPLNSGFLGVDPHWLVRHQLRSDLRQDGHLCLPL